MLLDHAGCSGDVPERRGCAGAPGMCQGCAGVQDLHHVLFVFLFELNCACGLVQHWPLHASNMFPKYMLLQSHKTSLFGIHMKILRFASSPTCCPCSDRFYPNLQRKEQKPRLQKWDRAFGLKKKSAELNHCVLYNVWTESSQNTYAKFESKTATCLPPLAEAKASPLALALPIIWKKHCQVLEKPSLPRLGQPSLGNTT